MTVTIIIIAVIVVLAVLVLLLLGMRALSLGSNDDYDDDYDDDVQDDRDDRPARGRGRGRADLDGDDEGDRGRRPSRPERRPKGRRQREVDWEDDSDGLSDNDFWSSLNDEGPAQTSPRDRGRDDAYDAGDVDGYEDYDDEPVRGGHPDQGPPTMVDAPVEDRVPRGSASDLAMLAGLGHSEPPGAPPPQRPEPRHPEPRHSPAALDSGPTPSALPPTQGLPPSQPTTPIDSGVRADDPLGTGWTPPPPSTGDPFEGREPLTQSERLGLNEGGDVPDPYGSDRTPLGTGSGSSDPLDPGFRPNPGEDFRSPIWSSMDTGAHQRSDLNGYGMPGTPSTPSGSGLGGPSGAMPAPGQPMGGPNVPGHPAPGPGSDPLTGGYPSGAFQGGPYAPDLADTNSFGRPEYDTGTHQRNPYDSGTHTRPSHQGGLTPPRPEYDTGQHSRPTYDTDSFTRPEYDTGTHQRNPYDSGTHTRPSHQGGLTPPRPDT
ncbi:hypothetical protein, partial [Nocardiopsis sp. NPDC006832]|uniref:hypothetical protein n=1 Tax=Nocardiopsis sp. NPDC006832 TaxID=3157188 RepID=UPI0033FFD03B